MPSNFVLLIAICSCVLPAVAQTAEPAVGMEQVLKRLDALETENRQMAEEIRKLRLELSAAQPGAPTAAERLDVTEQRVAEQAQTKVEASQKFPLSISGMLLFNAFASSKSVSSSYGLLNGPARDGGTFGQSIVGLQFQGPALPGNGKLSGSLTMDFWGGYTATPGLGWLRIREAEVAMDWKRRSLTFGQMKPLISPLAPSSLAEVSVPALSGAGNLWYWLPQVRYEERVRLGSQSGLNLQGSVMQTSETGTQLAGQYASTLQRASAALEGRAAIWRKFGETRSLEIGTGFHRSATHVAGQSLPSNIFAVDWSLTPFSKVQLTGSYYRGQNVAALGSLGNGVLIYPNGVAAAIHANAGWTQLALPITSRLTFNLFGGQEDDGKTYGISRNFSYAANAFYHFGPNVVMSVEALQSRLRYFYGTTRIVNHYDLALAYIF